MNKALSRILAVSLLALVGCAADATPEPAGSGDSKTSGENVGQESSAVTSGSCTLDLGGGRSETWGAQSREECEWSCIWRNMIGENCAGFSFHN